MDKMTLKVKVTDPYFQYQLRVSQDACLMQIWWFQTKSVMSYHQDKSKFLESWVKMAKIKTICQWPSASLQYLWCINNGDIIVQHKAIA